MMATGIQYLDENWTVLTGCSAVSEGCANCYAKALHDKRHKAYLAGKKMPQQYAQPFETIQFHADRLGRPLHWRKPRTIGVCFTGDLFHDDVPMKHVLNVLVTAAAYSAHRYMFLTKRAKRMSGAARLLDESGRIRSCKTDHMYWGITAENQARLDERAPEVLKIPGKHWLSAEPLLGPLDLGLDACYCTADSCDFFHSDSLTCPYNSRFSWVVVGAESGPNRRPCKLEWILDIVKQCADARVPCWVKQIPLPLNTERVLCVSAGVKFLDDIMEIEGKWRVSHDPNEWPESLRVQEHPK